MAQKAEEKPGFFSRLASSLTFGGSKKKAAQSPPQMKKRARRASIDEMDRNLSCEEMDSDDLGGDLNLSDSEGGQEERVIRRNYKAQKRATRNESVNKYRHEFDTNVFEVALDCLANKG